jgi:hypothetical protein
MVTSPTKAARLNLMSDAKAAYPANYAHLLVNEAFK